MNKQEPNWFNTVSKTGNRFPYGVRPSNWPKKRETSVDLKAIARFRELTDLKKICPKLDTD